MMKISIKNTLKNIRNNQFVKNVVIVGAGTIIGQLIGIIIAPILTRLYGIESFGVMNVFESIIGLVIVEASLNYEYAIPIAKNDAKAVNVLVLSLAICIIVSILTFIALLLLKPIFEQNKEYSVIIPFLWIIPIGICFAGSVNTLNYWAIRKGRFKTVAKVKLNQGTITAFLNIIFGLIKIGPMGLLLSYVSGYLGGALTNIVAFIKNDKTLLKNVELKELRNVAIRYKEYPLIQTWSSILNTLGGQIFPIFIAGYYGLEIAGYFYLTNKVISIPISFLANSIKSVYIGEIAKLKEDNPKELRKRFHKISKQMLAIGLIPCLILIIWGEEIFSIIFGREWSESGLYVQVMVFSFLLKFASDAYINLALLEKQRLSFIWSAIRLIGIIGVILIIKYLNVTPFYGIVLFTLITSMMYIFKYVLWEITLSKLSNRR